MLVQAFPILQGSLLLGLASSDVLLKLLMMSLVTIETKRDVFAFAFAAGRATDIAAFTFAFPAILGIQQAKRQVEVRSQTTAAFVLLPLKLLPKLLDDQDLDRRQL